MDTFTPTPISKVKRHPERGSYDRETVYAILDAGLACHVGYALGDQPMVTPTIPGIRMLCPVSSRLSILVRDCSA